MENNNSINPDGVTPAGKGENPESGPAEVPDTGTTEVPLVNHDEIPAAGLVGKKGKGGSGAARQTLYRVTVRNQLRSISIADQKANILIGINTILISIIIAGIGAGSSFAGMKFISELDLSIPFTFFLITCFGSFS